MAAGRSESPAQAGLDSAPSRSKSSGAAEISDDSDTDIDIEANGGESPLLTAPFVSILCISQWVAIVKVGLCSRDLTAALFADTSGKTVSLCRMLDEGNRKQAGYAWAHAVQP